MITCKFESGSEATLRHVTVAAIIVKDGKVLLSKRGTHNGRPLSEFGKWTLAGGYLEKDETAVEGLKREVEEELGCTLENIKLLRVVDNPIRPNEGKQNITFIFVADFVSQVAVQTEEVTEQRWFALTELPANEQIAFDHADDLALYKAMVSSNLKVGNWHRWPAEIYGL